jgi:hypothetical protein
MTLWIRIKIELSCWIIHNPVNIDSKIPVTQKEAHLFPVSIGSLWGGGETDSLMAVGKLNVEECH